MRILTLSLNAWNDTQATGNTFSNFFSGCDSNMVFYNVFCRNEPIQNDICSNYFCITEGDVLHALINKEFCGKRVKQSINKSNIKFSNTKSRVKDWVFHKYRPSILLFLRELIWLTNKWKNTNLDGFLKEAAPDIIYMHGHNNRYMHNILWYCQEVTSAKVVVFFGDDMYGYKSHNVGYLLYQNWLRKKLKFSIDHADLLLGGSEKLCEEYEGIFNKKFYVQYKTCTELCKPYAFVDKPELSMVYAGNLLYGRKEALIEIANLLKELNSKSVHRLKLYIYSSTVLTEKENSLLNDEANSFYLGAKSYKNICEILNNCDIALFLESFDKANKCQTRLSFSTKIIDYMQASSAIVAYGPNDIASIEYLMKSGIAIVANSRQTLASKLSEIISSPEMLTELAEKKYHYALEYHTKQLILKRFKDLLNKA